jgi:ectoine hydroxylase-related dioxygenase (phytanoyl-CoA dioxygenase family)
MTAIDIGPGEDPQPMHGDDIVMSRHLQRPHAPMMVTSMWALTDFTADNGGTRFVPGSHTSPETPETPIGRAQLERGDVEVRALEMLAGSVMVFHGSLWHGGGPNTTADEHRLGVNVQYCPGFVRQQQNPYLGIPPEIAETFSDRLLELLGYRLYKGIMGHVDGRSPGEVVFGDSEASDGVASRNPPSLSNWTPVLVQRVLRGRFSSWSKGVDVLGSDDPSLHDVTRASSLTIDP